MKGKKETKKQRQKDVYKPFLRQRKRERKVLDINKRRGRQKEKGDKLQIRMKETERQRL